MTDFTMDADAAGGILKAGSSIASGNARSSLENLNANIADQQATSEMEAGGYNANLARQKAGLIKGQQISSIGANNLTQGGTNSQVVADTAKAQEANALQIQNNSMRRAWGFQVQGASDTYQAGLAKQGGMLSGIGDLISTAGKTYKDYGDDQ